MFKSLRFIAAVVVHLLVWSCVAEALPIDRASDSTRRLLTPFDAPPRIEELEPSIYYLPDKQGNLQPVLDFKYQDFVDLYNLKNQLGRRDQPPRFSLQRISATGTVEQTRAELTVQFQVSTRDSQWVRVPLRLGQGLLRGPVQYKGSGRHVVQYEDESEGYVCWLRGKPDATHEITLNLLVPLESVAEQLRLKLSVPRAAASELKLLVPIANAVGTASEGATLQSSAAKGDATEFAVVGLGADFHLAWQKPNPAAEMPVVLASIGSVLVKFDGRTLATEASLSVGSHGAPFDRFTVRLPPNAEYTPGKTDGYVVTPLDPKPGEPRAVEVRLPKKTLGPIVIVLNCRRVYDPSQAAPWCELAGFEVVGAARQWGAIAVATNAAWQVHWGSSRAVRLLDPLPNRFRAENAVAGFEYSSQPYSLPVKLAPRKTRINIEPEYVLDIDRDQVRLNGKLNYTIRGAAVSTIELALPDWQFDDVGPDDLVVAEGVTVEGGFVSIPLKRPASGSVELRLRAHKPIGAADSSLAAAMPRPRDGAVSSASVAVVPADNLELIPDAKATAGLVRQRIAPPMKLPARQQDPLYYRSAGGEAVFAASFRIHPQRIAVDADTDVLLTDAGATIEQKFAYSIAHEPIGQFTISVPRDLAMKRIQVSIDGGKPVSTLLTPKDPAADPKSPTVLAKVALPEPCIGECELTLHYSVPSETAASETVAVPLAMPADGQLTSNDLVVSCDKSIHLTPRKGPWTVSDRDAADLDGRTTLSLTAPKPVNSIDFDVRRPAFRQAESTVVDRAWIQSWLASSERQDRAVFRLTTSQKQLDVTLPSGAVAEDAALFVDGQIVEPRRLDERRLGIPLPGARRGQPLTVELRYHFDSARPPRGNVQIDFPQLTPEAWIERLYWQVILPANEHLLGTPSGFNGEFLWQWDVCWGRVPLLDQEQLESWSGAAPRDPIPDRANVYLFSAFGKLEGAHFRTAARSWIVLCASGAALIAGLLLIYLPISRHPVTLIAAGLALLSAGAVAPEPTLLLAQAACLGLTLTLLAGLLERGVARRRRKVARKDISTPRVDITTTHSAAKPAVVNPNSASTEAIHPLPPPSASGNVSP